MKFMKLVYLSSGTVDLDKNKALGYHAVVTKPVKPSSLQNALMALFTPEDHTCADMDNSFVALPQSSRQWSPVKILVRLQYSVFFLPIRQTES